MADETVDFQSLKMESILNLRHDLDHPDHPDAVRLAAEMPALIRVGDAIYTVALMQLVDIGNCKGIAFVAGEDLHTGWEEI